MKVFVQTHGRVLLLLAAASILPYVPLVSQPLLQDDYPNIEQARLYGPVSNWPAMMSDPVFRYRATFWVLTHWIDRLFGPHPLPLYGVSVGLHLLNTWIIYSLGSWTVIGWPVATAAAGFFAIYEGHQEAVMWYSASSELLLFSCAALSLLFWIWFTQDARKLHWYLASLICFALALLSKESAVVVVPLLFLPLLRPPFAYRLWLLLGPFAAMAAAEAWLIFATRSNSFRFADGSFPLQAPFWIT